MIGALVRWLGRLAGWKVEGQLPDLPKYVLIGAPHTSNWDFILFLWAQAALRFSPTWLGKHTIFFWPLGVLWRRLGGVPVERGARLNVVDQVVERFNAADRMILVISPEGTRRKTRAWKSGFYHIARGAGVPVVPGSLDFPTRTVRIGTPVYLTGDMEVDLAPFRAFYASARGFRPGLASDIALSEPALPG
ncbi:MAG: lysophospholipid acyltransferase family protein [Gemmatimonadetes bacterium]|nr:lysophospholipid acyltransferase family protein [Gemmatimonadota bacterium]